MKLFLYLDGFGTNATDFLETALIKMYNVSQ